MTRTNISVDALREMLDQGRSVTVLDIRHTNEWAEWAIPGSINIDAYDALKAKDSGALAGTDLPGDRPVVTVCGAGVISQVAAEQLRGRGVRALSLTGGMKAWSLAWNYAEVPLHKGKAQVIQVRRTGKGCLSYLIGSEDVAAVIDPALEPEVYIGLAQDYGWTISHVLDTHIHADHLSRAQKLAEQCSAALLLPAQDRATYSFEAVQDKDVVDIGSVRLTALRTPGHTGESTCYLLDNQALFTGDTLFLAAIGRPDLEASPEEARSRAHMLYQSLQQILTLAPEILILPGHTSEPIAFDKRPIVASLGEVREQVEFLHLPENTFVESLLDRIPPPPPNHHRIVELNETGLYPDTDPTELEAGANRCAIA